MLLCEEMKAKSQKQFAVVGMSSSTWNYSKWMSIDQRVLYDKNAVRLGKAFARGGVSCDNGVSELNGIVPQDDIGHVSTDSQATVFAAFVSWVGRAETHGQTSTFTGGPPPPAKDLPAGWRSFWSGEHGCFWYLHKETAGRSWEKPPSVPDGWLVKWSTEYECFQFVNPKLQVCTWDPPSVGDESWVEVEVEEEPKESEVEDTDGVEADDEDDGEEDEVESDVWVEPACSQFVVRTSPAPPPPPPCGLAAGWMARWSEAMQRFTFRHVMTGGVSVEMPPEVPAGWIVSWSTEYECFQFLRRGLAVSSWIAPALDDDSWLEAWDLVEGRVVYVCGNVKVYMSPSSVPLPWKMMLNKEGNDLCFFNPVLNKFSVDAEGCPVTPLDMVQDENGYYYFEDAEDGTISYVNMPEPLGWDLCWDVSEQSFYWRCQSTGAVSYDEPHCADD